MAFNMRFPYDFEMTFPARIICLTEESVETLYLLGKEELIVGVSEYVVRPLAAKKLPVVTQFIRSDIEKIVELRPDLVIGFSDLQKDIAKELIGQGLNVLITNQRSLSEILDYILFLGRIVGEQAKAETLVSAFKALRKSRSNRPRVYFEEWDHPRLTASQWVSELIEKCGGENIFADRIGPLGKDRKVTDEEVIERNPDFILGCWCGKKVNIDAIRSRSGYDAVSAVKNNKIIELPPEIFLQPGPALFVDGLDFLARTLDS
jgi:iron complex transport system substrate-binding protein